MRLEHIPDCQLVRAPRTEVCPAERSEELRTHAVSEVGDAEPNSKVRPVIVQQIVAADAEMKGDAEARFSMSSQRRPRSFKEIPTRLPGASIHVYR